MMEDINFSDIKFEIGKEAEIKGKFLKRMATWRIIKKSLKNSPPKPGSRTEEHRISTENDLLSFLDICRKVLGISEADFLNSKQKEDVDLKIGDEATIKENFKKKVAELVLAEENHFKHSHDRIISSAVNEARRILEISDSVFSDIKSRVRSKLLQKKTEGIMNSADWLKKLDKK
jgi:hypothetical protein